ncbi:hypothetical protein F4780DRAFT_764390, partial [Xylariomycetidae sp. FL0641]
MTLWAYAATLPFSASTGAGLWVSSFGAAAVGWGVELNSKVTDAGCWGPGALVGKRGALRPKPRNVVERPPRLSLREASKMAASRRRVLRLTSGVRVKLYRVAPGRVASGLAPVPFWTGVGDGDAPRSGVRKEPDVDATDSLAVKYSDSSSVLAAESLWP